MNPTRILLVDDHILLRGALRRLIGSFALDSTIQEASNGKEALVHLAQHPVDLVLLDIQMPVMNGIDAMKEIRKLTSPPKVIVLTQFDEEALILQMLAMGVNSFVVKNCEDKALELAIKSVLENGFYYDHNIMGIMARNLSDKKEIASLTLTSRESQLLKLLAQGHSSKVLAQELQLSIRTVESYRKSLMEKTNCSNTAELVALAFRTGLVETSLRRRL